MKQLPKELFINVSEYDPPKPLEEVIELLRIMKKGEYIRMLHRKKPLPLLQLLQDNGFDFKMKDKQPLKNEALLTSALWEIIIWKKDDLPVNDFCLKI